MLKITFMKTGPLAVLMLTLLLLAACGGGSSSGKSPTDDEQSNAVTVRFDVPGLLQSSDVDEQDLTPTVTINGVLVDGFQRLSDGSWSRVKTLIPLTGPVNFSISWSTKYSNKTLVLGKADASVVVNSSTTLVTVDQSNFVTSSVDDDEDGISNFDELAQNTDPFTGNGNLVASSLRVKFTIPEVDYAGKLEVSAVWNGRQITLLNNGFVYEGTVRNLTPSEGAFRVYIYSGVGQARTQVYRYEVPRYVVKEGENTLLVATNKFVARRIDLKITAKIPDRNYRGTYSVKLFDVSKNTSSVLSSGNRNYTKTLEGVQAGSKQLAVEIRSTESGVLWARAKKYHTVKVGANALSFVEGDFSFAYDNDGDGTSNINDSHPTVANVDVNIPYASTGTPIIDGVFDEGPWGAATMLDASGSRLRINHLMMEQRDLSGLEDNDDVYEKDLRPWHTWHAMYDEKYLYLLVEVTQDVYPTCDSKDPWDDDDLNIYWDGDNSKGDKYDGVNDYHLLIPLFERGAECLNFNSNGRMINGVNSASLSRGDDLRYATGPSGTNAYIYEVRIGLKKAGITAGKIFGFDVHVDDDDDGGDRDQKWGWKHPSRKGSDVDETYIKPSVMGNVILN